MATIKANGQTYFIDTTKITTPSIKINNGIFVGVSNGSSKYVPAYIPLFSGNKGGTVDYNRYRYTLGGLKVDNLRAAVSRSFINSAPSVYILASSTRVANGTSVTITAYASDPDGDPVSYEWEGVSSKGYYVNVSGSNQTKSYRCRVHDVYGAYSSWSNQVSITWYEPNRSPFISITEYDASVYEGNSISVKFYYYDPDADSCRISWGYASFGSGGITRNVETGWIRDDVSPSATYRTVTIEPGGTLQDGQYGIWVNIVDSKGAYDHATRTVTKKAHTYKCSAKLFKRHVTINNYGGYDIWAVNITEDRLGGAKAFAFDWSNNGSDSWYISEYSWHLGYKPSSCTVKPITWDIGSETINVNGFNPYPHWVSYKYTRNYIHNIRSVGNYGTIWLSENAWTYAEWS